MKLNLFKLIIKKRNEMLLFVLNQLIKHIIYIYFKNIDFHNKRYLLITIFQDKCYNEHSLKSLKSFIYFLNKYKE